METVDSSQRQELTPLTASAQAPPRIRIHSASILPRPEYGFFDNAYQKAMRTLGLLAKIFCAPCLDLCHCTACSPIVRISQGFVGVLLEFGRVIRTLPPGLYMINVGSETVIEVSLRTQTMLLQKQEAVTKDTLSVTCDAVVFFTVEDAISALFEVENYQYAVQNLATVSLRTCIGENNLEELFAHRAQINKRLKTLLDEKTRLWGIRVDSVDIRDLTIPANLQRAMAAIAESTRAAESKVIAANGQLRAASVLLEAAQTMAREPMSLQLQWFEVLRELGVNDKMTTIVVPDNVRNFAIAPPSGS